MTTRWRYVAILLKAALAALLLLVVAFPDWDRFADKAMDTRAIAYPIAVMLLPAWWALRNRSGSRTPAGVRGRPFPWQVDALITAPFVIDVGGNALDLYDSVSRFDDACHFGNWALLGGAAGVALLRWSTLPRWAVGLSCAGIGAITAILWEVAEYGLFILDTPESVTIYRDTIGDLTLGLLGATFAGLLLALRARPSGSTSRTASQDRLVWPREADRRARALH